MRPQGDPQDFKVEQRVRYKLGTGTAVHVRGPKDRAVRRRGLARPHGGVMRGDFDEDEFDDNDPMEDDFDCGMDREGNCGKAGSEECDFECPYSGLDEEDDIDDGYTI